ncbi:nitrous oxide reductase accessory protein NosL [Brevibacillus laterosporus]|uniref:nitrous oxide reductase accessory protein NosL n=1 Tax=Brevibacillus laterosporus TaxID=1465 RepID=UPI00036D3C12|nr:nitrous oxide reductase accessory protein NosL [Brevibacillus laterosporus]ATO49955.1 nitrous-oxide reductase [Brevibacillus laterosporus DSM 25]MBG9802800.1 nitrous oxide reductase [Brevibacillus laterosporus]MED2006058.1 nitrous oxide reductase accessory protein NosL [Brevibacillus laterosporus]MED4766244.1 nitrous oxide reductase accessory protein NosL [Brevibacillus laterosporus]TPH17921.1 nitrous-oxide reductase [Brevibacillus laterosporus]
MKKTHMIWASIALVSALMTGCGGQSAQPVAINESVDKCDICNMQIADDHNATEIILKDGKALKFDDIGDLFAWIKKNGTEKIDVKFVRDYHSKEWMNLNDATFAYDKEFKTPMAYGVYSFKDKQSAEAFVKEQGKGQILTAEQLNSHNWEMNMDQMKDMKHHGDMEHKEGDKAGDHSQQHDASKDGDHSKQQHDAGKEGDHSVQQHDAGKSAGEHGGSHPSTETPASGTGH